MTTRRELLVATSIAAIAAFGLILGRRGLAATEGTFEVTKSEEEWRALLTPAQFNVLRQHGTERPFTSELLDEHGEGTFACAGCDLPLYASATKYDSGTGWPSFWEAIEGNVGTSTDTSFLMIRTEVHCRRCGGHLGHIFNDGPPPTGMRHCINGVAMVFHPADAAVSG
jgi:peptide-methionine (R)-S-oxide reductase